MAEILRVIKPVSNQKFIRSIKTNELRVVRQVLCNALVKQGADFQRSRLPFLQYSHETIQSAARINDILYQEYVLALQTRFGVVNEVHGPAGNRPISVTRGDEKIDLKWTTDLTYEIAEKNEASFQQAQNQKIAVGISACNFAAELTNPTRDHILIEGNTFYSSTGKAWISSLRT